jgi:polyhydroxyalkanoate synthesis repressor PhaR
MPRPEAPIVIKRYANRRLYDTGTAAYVTLDDLAGRVRLGEGFIVRDAGTGEDITRSTLTLISSPITEH